MNKFTKIKKALAVSLCSSMLCSEAPKILCSDVVLDVKDNKKFENIFNNSIDRLYNVIKVNTDVVSDLKENTTENIRDIMLSVNDKTGKIFNSVEKNGSIGNGIGTSILYLALSNLVISIFANTFGRFYRAVNNYLSKSKLEDAIKSLEPTRSIIARVRKIMASEKFKNIPNGDLEKDCNCFLNMANICLKEADKYRIGGGVFKYIYNLFDTNSPLSMEMFKNKSLGNVVSALKILSLNSNNDNTLKKVSNIINLINNNITEIEINSILDRVEEILDESRIEIKNKNDEIKNEGEEEKKENRKMENQKQKISESKDNFLNSNNPNFLNILNNKGKKII